MLSYRNVTSGAYISGADCYLYVNGGNDIMTPDGNDYVYQKSFILTGIYDYNVICSKTGFNTLTANDSFQVIGSMIPEFSGMSLLISLIITVLGLFVFRKWHH